MSRAVLVMMGHENRPTLTRKVNAFAKKLGHELVATIGVKADFVDKKPQFVADRVNKTRATVAILAFWSEETGDVLAMCQRSKFPAVLYSMRVFLRNHMPRAA